MSQKVLNANASHEGAASKSPSDIVSKLLTYISQFFEQQMNAQDITPAQFDILLTLWNEDGLISSILGKRIEKDGPTTTGMVDRMERKGFVRRKRSTTDRRAVQIFLTPKAWALQEKMMHMQQELLRRADIHEAADKDIETLEGLMSKIITNIEKKVLAKEAIRKHLRKGISE